MSTSVTVHAAKRSSLVILGEYRLFFVTSTFEADHEILGPVTSLRRQLAIYEDLKHDAAVSHEQGLSVYVRRHVRLLDRVKNTLSPGSWTVLISASRANDMRSRFTSCITFAVKDR